MNVIVQYHISSTELDVMSVKAKDNIAMSMCCLALISVRMGYIVSVGYYLNSLRN